MMKLFISRKMNIRKNLKLVIYISYCFLEIINLIQINVTSKYIYKLFKYYTNITVTLRNFI